MLVHDDGSGLWIVPLHGRQRLIWRHPRIAVDQLTAGPGGHELALSITLTYPNPYHASSILYLMRPDGSIETVDAVRNLTRITAPAFIRPPSDPRGPVRLVWVRMSQSRLESSTGGPPGQVMMSVDGRARPVAIALLDGEGPLEISSYPGTDIYTLDLLRLDQEPTSLELRLDDDITGAGRPHPGPLRWSSLQFIGNTDDPSTPAWIRPGEFVTLLDHQDAAGWYSSVRVFDWSCGGGSHVAGAGQRLDLDQGPSWQIQPIDRDHVLVLTAAEVARVADHRDRSAPWYELNVFTGRLVRTGARWSPVGSWTATRPAAPATPAVGGSCKDFSTYP